MSLFASNRTFSPEPSTTYYDDDQFDSDFLKYIHSSPPPFEFDYLSPKISDEMSHSHQNQNQNHLDDGRQVTDQGVTKVETNERVVEVDRDRDGDRDGDAEGQEDVPMNTSLDSTNTTSPFRMQDLHIDEHSTPSHIPHIHDQNQNQHQNQNQNQIHVPMAHPVDLYGHNLFQPYQMSGSYPATSTPIHPYHFHPYSNPRDYSNAMRARSPVSPIRPMSPPLSVSPPGSTSSHQSPHLVSPVGGNHQLDASPAGLGFHYQLPFTNTLSMSSVNASVASAPISGPDIGMGVGMGMGLGMVQGFPYPTTSLPLAQAPSSVGRAGRPRMSRGTTARSNKRSSVGGGAGGSRGVGGGQEDDDSDFDEDDRDRDRDRNVGSSTGLGFSPTIQEGDDRIPISNKREDIRKARIESEQRRRDELREGFRRLKEVLPQTTQRSSKSSLLDRSVAHIQSIEAANRYLLQQYEAANKELEKLRQTNTELVHAVASNSRASHSNSNSPHGHGHGNGSAHGQGQGQGHGNGNNPRQ